MLVYIFEGFAEYCLLPFFECFCSYLGTCGQYEETLICPEYTSEGSAVKIDCGPDAVINIPAIIDLAFLKLIFSLLG